MVFCEEPVINKDHPLVGLKLVDDNAQEGEVSRKLITGTLGEVTFEVPGHFGILNADKARWVVRLDPKSVIQEVTKL
jgi:hypothetical protein